jgi:hypothetical protein
LRAKRSLSGIEEWAIKLVLDVLPRQNKFPVGSFAKAKQDRTFLF